LLASYCRPSFGPGWLFGPGAFLISGIRASGDIRVIFSVVSVFVVIRVLHCAESRAQIWIASMAVLVVWIVSVSPGMVLGKFAASRFAMALFIAFR